MVTADRICHFKDFLFGFCVSDYVKDGFPALVPALFHRAGQGRGKAGLVMEANSGPPAGNFFKIDVHSSQGASAMYGYFVIIFPPVCPVNIYHCREQRFLVSPVTGVQVKSFVEGVGQFFHYVRGKRYPGSMSPLMVMARGPSNGEMTVIRPHPPFGTSIIDQRWITSCN